MPSSKRRQKPARRPGRSSGYPRPSQAELRPADLGEQCKRLLEDSTAHTRLVLAGDPILGSLQIHTPATEPERSDEAARDPIPVAIIEPSSTIHVPFAGRSHAFYDVRTAISLKLGFYPLGSTTATITPAPAWTFAYGTPSALLDPTGSALATFTARASPEWIHQAERHGAVAVIYGVKVGVIRPGTTPPWEYDDQARAAELAESRRQGTVTSGLVTFAQA